MLTELFVNSISRIAFDRSSHRWDGFRLGLMQTHVRQWILSLEVVGNRPNNLSTPRLEKHRRFNYFPSIVWKSKLFVALKENFCNKSGDMFKLIFIEFKTFSFESNDSECTRHRHRMDCNWISPQCSDPMGRLARNYSIKRFENVHIAPHNPDPSAGARQQLKQNSYSNAK